MGSSGSKSKTNKHIHGRHDAERPIIYYFDSPQDPFIHERIRNRYRKIQRSMLDLTEFGRAPYKQTRWNSFSDLAFSRGNNSERVKNHSKSLNDLNEAETSPEDQLNVLVQNLKEIRKRIKTYDGSESTAKIKADLDKCLAELNSIDSKNKMVLELRSKMGEKINYYHDSITQKEVRNATNQTRLEEIQSNIDEISRDIQYYYRSSEEDEYHNIKSSIESTVQLLDQLDAKNDAALTKTKENFEITLFDFDHEIDNIRAEEASKARSYSRANSVDTDDEFFDCFEEIPITPKDYEYYNRRIDELEKNFEQLKNEKTVFLDEAEDVEAFESLEYSEDNVYVNEAKASLDEKIYEESPSAVAPKLESTDNSTNLDKSMVDETPPQFKPKFNQNLDKKYVDDETIYEEMPIYGPPKLQPNADKEILIYESQHLSNSSNFQEKTVPPKLEPKLNQNLDKNYVVDEIIYREMPIHESQVEVKSMVLGEMPKPKPKLKQNLDKSNVTGEDMIYEEMPIYNHAHVEDPKLLVDATKESMPTPRLDQNYVDDEIIYEEMPIYESHDETNLSMSQEKVYDEPPPKLKPKLNQKLDKNYVDDEIIYQEMPIYEPRVDPSLSISQESVHDEPPPKLKPKLNQKLDKNYVDDEIIYEEMPIYGSQVQPKPRILQEKVNDVSNLKQKLDKNYVDDEVIYEEMPIYESQVKPKPRNLEEKVDDQAPPELKPKLKQKLDKNYADDEIIYEETPIYESHVAENAPSLKHKLKGNFDQTYADDETIYEEVPMHDFKVVEIYGPSVDGNEAEAAPKLKPKFNPNLHVDDETIYEEMPIVELGYEANRYLKEDNRSKHSDSYEEDIIYESIAGSQALPNPKLEEEDDDFSQIELQIPNVIAVPKPRKKPPREVIYKNVSTKHNEILVENDFEDTVLTNRNETVEMSQEENRGALRNLDEKGEIVKNVDVNLNVGNDDSARNNDAKQVIIVDTFKDVEKFKDSAGNYDGVNKNNNVYSDSYSEVNSMFYENDGTSPKNFDEDEGRSKGIDGIRSLSDSEVIYENYRCDSLPRSLSAEECNANDEGSKTFEHAVAYENIVVGEISGEGAVKKKLKDISKSVHFSQSFSDEESDCEAEEIALEDEVEVRRLSQIPKPLSVIYEESFDEDSEPTRRFSVNPMPDETRIAFDSVMECVENMKECVEDFEGTKTDSAYISIYENLMKSMSILNGFRVDDNETIEYKQRILHEIIKCMQQLETKL